MRRDASGASMANSNCYQPNIHITLLDVVFTILMVTTKKILIEIPKKKMNY